MIQKIIGVLALVLLFASSSLAVSCHCFNQREFDRSDPFSADSYILATAGNSLLSGSTATDKGTIVRALMGGTLPPDLWIGLSAAKASGTDSGLLLSTHENEGSWAKTFAIINLKPEILGDEFAKALPADEPGAARVLADKVLSSSFPGEDKAIADLRKEGATTGETSVALFLKSALALDPVPTLRSVRSLKKSWGSYLADANLTPKEFSKKLILLSRPSP